jgi:hypothetical protein
MKPVKTHTFNGRRYKIVVKPPLDGLCSQYKNERELIIMESLRTKNGLITALHEGLHAENWAAKEEVVDRVSKELGTFLWRLGFRWAPDKL